MASNLTPSKHGSAPKHANKKGFTLVEILLVMALMAFLAIAGLSNTISSQRQYSFMNMFKGVMAKIREPRMYAVTNTTVPDIYNSLGIDPEPDKAIPYIPPEFGVYITRYTNESGVDDKYLITTFADQEGGADPIHTAGPEGEYDDKDYNMGVTYEIDATKYELEIFTRNDISSSNYLDPDNHAKKIGQGDPDFNDRFITLFYKPPFAGFGMNYDVDGLADGESSLYIKLYDKRDERIYRYIAIFESGIAEGFYESALTGIVTTAE